MQAVLPLYDAEIQLAADNGDDEVYTQNARAANCGCHRFTKPGRNALTSVINAVVPGCLPSLVVANKLYQDATRLG
jgi:hypothetical protein